MKRVLAITFFAFLAGGVWAHDMWLEPDAFMLEAAGATVTVRNGNGMIYQNSENAVEVDRIAVLTGREPNGRVVKFQDPRTEGNWLVLGFEAEEEGNYWVGLATKPSRIGLSGAEFTEYLEHDGIPNVLQEREAKGISDRGEVEQYSKFVKTFLQVGNRQSQIFDVPLGLEIEIVPSKNPYALEAGDLLPVQVLFRGQPLEGLTLHAGFWGQPGHPEAVTTGKDGRAAIRIVGEGKWYVRGVQLFQVDAESHSYESYWATLTFEVPPRKK